MAMVAALITKLIALAQATQAAGSLPMPADSNPSTTEASGKAKRKPAGKACAAEQASAASRQTNKPGSRNSIFIYAPVEHPTSIQKSPNNKNYQDIAKISATFSQHSASLHDARNRTFTLTYENDDHSCRVEHAAPSPRHARWQSEPRSCCHCHVTLSLGLIHVGTCARLARAAASGDSMDLKPESLCPLHSLPQNQLNLISVLALAVPGSESAAASGSARPLGRRQKTHDGGLGDGVAEASRAWRKQCWRY